MSDKEAENGLVEKLKETLTPQFKQIWTRKKLSTSPYFRNHIKGKLGYVPILQPELDMVFKTKDDKLNAIEVKYLNSTTKGYNIPYYVGIGQALALQRFGFDHVGLWLLVGENISDEELNRYGPEAGTFIRKELKLDIEYSFLRVSRKDDRTKFLVMNYTDRQTSIKLVDVDHRLFRMTWKFPNPMKDKPEPRVLREGIELYLNGGLR